MNKIALISLDEHRRKYYRLLPTESRSLAAIARQKRVVIFMALLAALLVLADAALKLSGHSVWFIGVEYAPLIIASMFALQVEWGLQDWREQWSEILTQPMNDSDGLTRELIHFKASSAGILRYLMVASSGLLIIMVICGLLLLRTFAWVDALALAVGVLTLVRLIQYRGYFSAPMRAVIQSGGSFSEEKNGAMALAVFNEAGTVIHPLPEQVEKDLLSPA